MDPINPEVFQNNQLSVSGLPTVDEVKFDRLSPKYLIKSYITTSLSFMIFLVFGVGVFYLYPEVFRGYFPLILSGIVMIFLWSYFSNWQWLKRSGYALRERDLIYKRGFLAEKTTVVPFNRIQHVSTQRGIFDKMLGISTLQIFTAGGSGSDISIPGLTPSLALSLKAALSDRISQHV